MSRSCTLLSRTMGLVTLDEHYVCCQTNIPDSVMLFGIDLVGASLAPSIK